MAVLFWTVKTYTAELLMLEPSMPVNLNQYHGKKMNLIGLVLIV